MKRYADMKFTCATLSLFADGQKRLSGPGELLQRPLSMGKTSRARVNQV